ncbi:MAG: PhzF family phenazine biosynthesis protein, partial [Sedimentibacter sp.]
YKKIDAFTLGKSLGNPAACIYLEDNQTLSDDEMLGIAKQHKGFVSEVVYCSKSQQSGFNLKYFSSECEVDFCGHGTIACMYSLIKRSPILLKKNEIVIYTNKKGTLTVYNKISEQDAVFITAPEPTFFETKLSLEAIAENLGLETDKISYQYQIDLINAGLTTLIVPVVSLSYEINVFPNEQHLKEFCLENKIDIVLIFSTEVKDNKNIAHTRVFAPRFGYLEDPATGSGNSAFGYYMLKNNMWQGENVSIEQGGSNIEFNIVKLTTQNNKILFGGSSTDRIIGKYYL